MGRKKATEIRKYYRRNDNKQECLIENCKAVLTGDNITNMERHLQKKHKDKYISIRMATEPPITTTTKHVLQKVTILTSESMLWEGCIEMATSGGLPLSFISSRGFKKIIFSVTSKLSLHKQFNEFNLKANIIATAEKIKSEIKRDVKDCLISIKFDAVSRLGRSLLGINIQYIKNQQIVIKTLAIKELNSRHTGDYLRLVIKDVLMDFGIYLWQIYSVTSDNGSNMLKATQLLREDMHSDMANDSEDDCEVEEYLCENNIHEVLLPDCSEIVNCIRCAAHTLQLVVTDSIKEQNLVQKISGCRRLAVALRKPTNLTKIRNQGLRLPILNVAIRWNSTFDMFERLQELKDFCTLNPQDDQDLYIEDELWLFIVEFLNVFRPIKIATLQLQSQNLIFGDFYKHWLRLKIGIKKQNSPIAATVHIAIQRREKMLQENIVFKAAIFLDPRFNFLLTDTQKHDAQEHLKRLFDFMALKYIQHQSETALSAYEESLPSQNHFQTGSDNTDDLSAYLNEKEAEQNRTNTTYAREMSISEITNYKPERIRDLSCDILKYWDVCKDQ